MNRFESILGVRIREGKRFTIAQHRYRIGKNGMRAAHLLCEIVAQFSNLESFSFRSVIQNISALRLLECSSFLSYVIDQTSKPEIRILTIWLRGFCGGHIGTSIIYRYAKDSDPRLRFRVGSALRRMEATVQLANIAESELDPRIERIARRKPTASFVERMTTFSENVRREAVEIRKRKKLFLSPDVRLRYWAPKAAESIRIVLERIRSLVRSQ